jgi:hypothetical protein
MKKYIMLSVLEDITASKWPSLSLPFVLVFIPVEWLLHYLRRSVFFSVFVEPLNLFESYFIRGEHINLFSSAILFTIGNINSTPADIYTCCYGHLQRDFPYIEKRIKVWDTICK